MMSAEWLSAFIPIGFLNSKDAWRPEGAGVLLHDPPFIWLVTANHVIPAKTDDRVGVLVTQKQGQQRICIDLSTQYRTVGLQWIRDTANDVAAALMPVNSEWDIKAVGDELCVGFDDLLPSMQCYTVGCPYGVAGVDPQKATPLVLEGIVAGVDSSSRLIYISTPTFPGNSGGPIIVVRPPYTAGGNLVVGSPTVLLAGLVRDQVIVRGGEGAPMLHLGRGAPITVCRTLIKSDEARRQLGLVPHTS